MTFAEALAELLGTDQGSRIQALYLELSNGKTLIFLGAPLEESDADAITSFHFGEEMDPVLLAILAKKQREEIIQH